MNNYERFAPAKCATAVNPLMAKNLIPAIYSKAKTARQIVKCIRANPTQRVDGGIRDCIDFQIDGTGPYGSLAEFAAAKPHIENYFLYPRSGNGVVYVVRKGDTFHIEEAAE